VSTKCVFCGIDDPNGTTFHVRGKLPFRLCSKHSEVANTIAGEVGAVLKDAVIDAIRQKLLPTKKSKAVMAKLMKTKSMRALLGLEKLEN